MPKPKAARTLPRPAGKHLLEPILPFSQQFIEIRGLIAATAS